MFTVRSFATGLLLVLIPATLHAHAVLTVLDRAGACIPRAQVQIDPTAENLQSSPLLTDARGEVALDLTPGTHLVVIAAQGFEMRRLPVTVSSEMPQTIQVTLDLAQSSCSAGCLSIGPAEPLQELLQSPTPLYIPLREVHAMPLVPRKSDRP